MKPQFCVGTIKNPTDSDSHAWHGKWSANCVNHWVATLGHKLTVETAITIHMVIVIHEITHALSREQYCWNTINGKTVYWDEFIEKYVVKK